MIVTPPSWPDRFPWTTDDLLPSRIPGVWGSHGAQAYGAPDGSRWLFKTPRDPQHDFLPTLDEATARLQAHVGLTAAPTYVVTLEDRRGSIQRMFPSYPGFPRGYWPSVLRGNGVDVVLRHHVFDWSIANHDGHEGQFVRTYVGDALVGIDKSQAFRWLGQDELDWEFRPNYWDTGQETVANLLWWIYSRGHPDLKIQAPGAGPLGQQIRASQAVDDDDLRELLTPYAEQAAAQGRLCFQDGYPDLTDPRIPENDVGAFLDAVVERKHALADDFADLHRRARAARIGSPIFRERRANAAEAFAAAHRSG